MTGDPMWMRSTSVNTKWYCPQASVSSPKPTRGGCLPSERQLTDNEGEEVILDEQQDYDVDLPDHGAGMDVDADEQQGDLNGLPKAEDIEIEEMNRAIGETAVDEEPSDDEMDEPGEEGNLRYGEGYNDDD